MEQENEVSTELNFAQLMITLEGETGQLPDAVQYDLAEDEVRRIASEAVSTGLAGISPRQEDFQNFVIDRMPPRDGLPARLHLRPKTAFGADGETVGGMEREMLLLKGEIQTRQHIQDVNTLLLRAAQQLIQRAELHDASKLGPEEHEKFSLAAARFMEPWNQYGAQGYLDTKAWLGSALEHHYAHNSHHPEHYEDGVMGMDLFDLLEMLLDWKAASARRSADGVLDLSLNRTNHKVPEPIMQILRNTADNMGFEYK